MGQTTVLERRHSMRRGGVSTSGEEPETPETTDGFDGRADAASAEAERRRGVERREYVPQHHITVGRVAGSGGWMGGVCSCGEHTLSRIEGLIESWARWHRAEVMAQRSSFVHSS